ncbi:hypothetical protein [Piscibacillus salipiscarius]|uniref:hypothetical protein n=1 Tax=Piscibacillus salipiscarius TaxID=299480 RepID=UPI002436FFA0|nr:hypothetical protein [Piscibacillus salipiscarius]
MSIRQQPVVQEVMDRLRSEHNNLYAQLTRAGISRRFIDYIFYLVVSYTVNQAETGQSARQIYIQFQRQVPWLNQFFLAHNVPQNLVDRVLRTVIEITLDIISDDGDDDDDDNQWSSWENLGGRLTSAPAVSSWQANRLDVFARGQNQDLIHNGGTADDGVTGRVSVGY